MFQLGDVLLLITYKFKLLGSLLLILAYTVLVLLIILLFKLKLVL